MGDKHSSGKGDKYRSINRRKWDEGWEKAFKKDKPNKKKEKETK